MKNYVGDTDYEWFQDVKAAKLRGSELLETGGQTN